MPIETLPLAVDQRLMPPWGVVAPFMRGDLASQGLRLPAFPARIVFKVCKGGRNARGSKKNNPCESRSQGA